jgi:dihydroorotate dehydrogenase
MVIIYNKVIRPIFFLFEPEFIHNLALWYLSWFSKYQPLNKLMFRACNYTSDRLRQKIWGLYFRNPVGLAAGMDKNASATNAWSAMDFGWAQIGSVTDQAQPGNKKPRLWRLPKDKGLVVYYGLSNIGAKKIAKKIKKDRQENDRGMISISIAKSSAVSREEAAADYARSFATLEPVADIITINLSCPNVKDFSGLQNKKYLEPILEKVIPLNKNKKPIWLKIGNNLSKEQLDEIIYLVKKYQIAAVVASNLSKQRDHLNLQSKYKDKPGGVSGKAIAPQANKIIAYLYKHSEGKYKIVGVGGIFDGRDAYDKIKAGADLVQLITGFIYNGPSSIKVINKELDHLLTKDNFKHISQAIGKEANEYTL